MNDVVATALERLADAEFDNAQRAPNTLHKAMLRAKAAHLQRSADYIRALQARVLELEARG